MRVPCLVSLLVVGCGPDHNPATDSATSSESGSESTSEPTTGGPTKLFDEQGTWALIKYDLGEGFENLDLQERVDNFLLAFDPTTEIVAAAACIDSMGNSNINESLCDTGEFVCRCFNYTFEEAQMTWIEFQPEGNPAPPVPPDDGTPKPGEPFVIDIEPYPESNSTYRYSGLPYALLSSDGVSSKYVFQIRGQALFTFTGCLEICGASG